MRMDRFFQACLGRKVKLGSPYHQEVMASGRPGKRELEFVNATGRALVLLVLPTSWSNKAVLKVARGMEAQGVEADAAIARAVEQSIHHYEPMNPILLNLGPRGGEGAAEGQRCPSAECSLSGWADEEARVVLVTAEAGVIAVWDYRTVRERTRFVVLPGLFAEGTVPLLGWHDMGDLARQGCARSCLGMALVAMAKGLAGTRDGLQQSPVSTVASV